MNRFSSWAYGVRARPSTLQSRKAPNSALKMPGWSDSKQPLWPTFDNQKTIDRVYLRNVYAYRCIESIANSISGLPFRAGDPLTNNFRLTAPLAQLLGPAKGSPTPWMSAAMLWRYSIAQYLLLGRFAWAIEREAGPNSRITGLWPLQVQHLTPHYAGTGAYPFDYFEYGTRGQEGYHKYQPDEIVYIWRSALGDYRQAESPVQAASVNVDVLSLLDQFDRSFLKNGGVPAHLIVTPSFATDEEREGFQSQFEAEFGGAANAGRTMFAEYEVDSGESGDIETVDVKIIGTSQRDAQLVNLRQADIQAVCVAFGVPLSILGDASHRTFSNAEQERRNYWLETLLPRTRELQDGVNVHLVPKLVAASQGSELGWFDTTGVPELQPEPRLPKEKALDWVLAGIFTPDELRADYGFVQTRDEVGLKGPVVNPAPAPFGGPGDVAQQNGSPKPAAGSLAKQANVKVVPPQKAPALPQRRSEADGLNKVLTSISVNFATEQATSMRARMTNRRNKRNSANAEYDVNYWSVRADGMIGPVLRELGVTDVGWTRQLAQDGETAFMRHEGSADDLDQLFNGVVRQFLMRVRQHTTLRVDDVQKALLAVHTGKREAADVLRDWQVTR